VFAVCEQDAAKIVSLFRAGCDGDPDSDQRCDCSKDTKIAGQWIHDGIDTPLLFLVFAELDWLEFGSGSNERNRTDLWSPLVFLIQGCRSGSALDPDSEFGSRFRIQGQVNEEKYALFVIL
jgi:hypothetical protein